MTSFTDIGRYTNVKWVKNVQRHSRDAFQKGLIISIKIDLVRVHLKKYGVKLYEILSLLAQKDENLTIFFCSMEDSIHSS